MEQSEYYDRIGMTGERDPLDFDKKCEDCGHMVSNHGPEGCEAPTTTLSGNYLNCGCTSYEWEDDDE